MIKPILMKTMFKLTLAVLIFPLVGMVIKAQVPAEQPAQPVISKFQERAPVVINEDTLFFVEHGIGAFTAAERAMAIETRISMLLRTPEFNADSLKINHSEPDYFIVTEEWIIMAVTPMDAEGTGISTE
jgi:hypothetical protein